MNIYSFSKLKIIPVLLLSMIVVEIVFWYLYEPIYVGVLMFICALNYYTFKDIGTIYITDDFIYMKKYHDVIFRDFKVVKISKSDVIVADEGIRCLVLSNKDGSEKIGISRLYFSKKSLEKLKRDIGLDP